MKRQAIVVTAVALFIFGIPATGALKAADMPDCIKIENQGYTKDRKGPVSLSHKKHIEEYKVGCMDCHHVYKDGTNVWKETDPVQKCSECHNPAKDEGKVVKLMNAFHNNCQGCHKAAVEKGNKNAPARRCNDCHSKK